MTTTQTTEKCLTCQHDEKRDSGQELTQAERNHWSMWGCTCSPESAQAAADYARLVTR